MHNIPTFQSALSPWLADQAKVPGFAPRTAPIQLHRNELPFDWPIEVKTRISQELIVEPWNRYPSSHAEELNAAISSQLRLAADQVQVGPGGNHAINLVLSLLAPKASKVVVLRPSYLLYARVTSVLDVPVEFWDLNEDLEIDFANLPALPPGSLVIFASPNNPTGSVVPRQEFEAVLKSNPQALFVVDAAYDCFAKQNIHELLTAYDNVMVLQSFTKSYGAAAARCGYVAGAASIMSVVRRYQPQFMLNPLSMKTIAAIVQDSSLSNYIQAERAKLEFRRDDFVAAADRIENKSFSIRNTATNFILLHFTSASASAAAWQHLLTDGILVVNCSHEHLLRGALRISIGTDAEMKSVLASLQGLRP